MTRTSRRCLRRGRQLRRRLGELRPGRRATASSASATTAPGTRWAASSRSTPTRRTTRSTRRWPRTPTGNFVVVWASSCQDGVEQRRLRPALRQQGEPLGGEFRVNTYTTKSQIQPVGGLGSGRQLRRRLGELRPGRRRIAASSASATPARERRWAGSSRSTPIRRPPGVAPRWPPTPAGNFVVVWESDLARTVVTRASSASGTTATGTPWAASSG